MQASDLIDHPERFPRLYGDVHRRWPDRRVCEKFARIVGALRQRALTPLGLSRKTGIERRTLYRLIKRLKAAQLVVEGRL
jgi:hypothetical protein